MSEEDRSIVAIVQQGLEAGGCDVVSLRSAGVLRPSGRPMAPLSVPSKGADTTFRDANTEETRQQG